MSRVYSDEKRIEVFWDRVLICPEETCWHWTGARNSGGYGQFNRLRGKRVLAHRFSYELTYGQIPYKLEVCHQCDNPGCVRPEHLFLGTHKENMLDAVKKGRLKRAASKAGSSQKKPTAQVRKLSVEQVLAIRSEWQQGISKASLARQYGFNETTIGRVINRRNYKYL